MKPAIFALALSSVVFAADYRDVNKTVALSANGSVEIENHKGAIRVTVWDRQEVEIEARIQAEIGTTMDRRRFDATEVRIDSSSNSVTIRTYYPDFNNWCCDDNGNNPEVRYTVHMPKTAKLTIRDHRSDTDVTGLQAVLDIATHRGTVHVHGQGGALHLDNYRGDSDVDFSSFTAGSSVNTYRGMVSIAIPKNSRFDVDSEVSRRGAVETDFTVMSRAIVRRGDSMHGTVNGGGPSLHLVTGRGEVRLHAK